MDKIDFATFLESTGQEFQARIQRARFYQHPSGIGDAREDVVRQYLQEILSPRFCVDRGKIFDSEGRLSREFDVIVSEANDIAPAMTLAGRRIVPIEAVYGVIEVKSNLKHDNYRSFIAAVTELDQMKRYYHALHPLTDADNKAITEGLLPQDKLAGKIWSGIIAFKAPNGKTLSGYLTECCEGFWFICVPGKELVTTWSKPFGFVGVPFGLKSFPLAVWLMMDLVNSNRRPRMYFPNFSQYRKTIVESIGTMKDVWRVELETSHENEPG